MFGGCTELRTGHALQRERLPEACNLSADPRRKENEHDHLDRFGKSTRQHARDRPCHRRGATQLWLQRRSSGRGRWSDDRELRSGQGVQYTSYGETGAVPSDFELRVPMTPLGAVNLTGFVDRIDRTRDGSVAFVIDYKTGRTDEYEKTIELAYFAGLSHSEIAAQLH
jgi:RecB family exonuclease